MSVPRFSPVDGRSAMAEPRLRVGRRPTAAIACVALLCLTATALAQRGFGGFGGRRLQVLRNIPYDGRLTFVRVNSDTAPGGYWAGGRPAWSHG